MRGSAGRLSVYEHGVEEEHLVVQADLGLLSASDEAGACRDLVRAAVKTGETKYCVTVTVTVCMSPVHGFTSTNVCVNCRTVGG